jgi:hypothetical protein
MPFPFSFAISMPSIVPLVLTVGIACAAMEEDGAVITMPEVKEEEGELVIITEGPPNKDPDEAGLTAVVAREARSLLLGIPGSRRGGGESRCAMEDVKGRLSD